MFEYNKNALSKTGKRIERTGIGFRYEGCSTGTYLLKDSLLFEVIELGNVDIFITLQNLYNINTNSINAIINWAQVVLKSDKVYGLWVSTKAGIERNYINDYDYKCGNVEIVRYELPKNRLLLSDLGDEGILYAIPCIPNDLPQSYVKVNKYMK